jgi:hypothetical protein
MTAASEVNSVGNCRRCQTPLETGDLRCAICCLPTPPLRREGATARAEVLRCDECGAAISYDVRVQAPHCGFCGSLMQLERSLDPLEEAEAYLPFRVDPQAAQKLLRSWLSTRGFFRPSDLASSATLASLRPIGWVGWIFDCEALVSWTADSDDGRNRAAWAPHAGQSPLALRSVLVSASRGLRDVETHALAPGFDLGTALPSAHAMDGATVERFDVQRSAARQVLANAIQSTAAMHVRPWIPGSAIRNLRVSVLLRRLTTRRVALPSYVLAYRYRGTLHRVVIHGQDPRVILGDSPVSLWKILVVIAVLSVALALAVTL